METKNANELLKMLEERASEERCNHCGDSLTLETITRTAPDRMFRGMCHNCEALPLEERLKKAATFRAG